MRLTQVENACDNTALRSASLKCTTAKEMQGIGNKKILQLSVINFYKVIVAAVVVVVVVVDDVIIGVILLLLLPLSVLLSL